MALSPDGIQTVFDELHQALSYGWLYTCSARHLQLGFQGKQITCARYFFISSYQACINQSRAVLSKLTKSDPEHATLLTLLETGQAHPDTFPFASPMQMARSTKKFQILLNETANCIQQMQPEHLLRIAELEKIQEDDETFTRFLASYDLENIAKCYQALLKTINNFYGYYQNSNLHFRFIEEEMQDDVGFLMQLLSSGCI